MRTYATFVLVWLMTGVCAVLVSAVGAALGRPFLFAGALVGGGLGAAAGVTAAVRLRWLAREEWRLSALGGIAGFALATPIAMLNLRTPVRPILACALAGAGALFGAGLARKR